MALFKDALKLSFVLLIVFLCIGTIYAEEDVNGTDNFTDTVEIPTRPYLDLNNQLNDTEDGSVLILEDNYKFDPVYDNNLSEGIQISKNISLVGKNSISIDGSFLARGLTISPNCNVVLENITFKNGYTLNSGGAINVGENATLKINNCIFHSNTVYNSNGGAIFGQDGSDIEIHHSEFYNNTGIRESKLAWKDFKKGMGSAICMKIGTDLRLFDSIIRDNVGYLTTILIVTWDDVNTQQSTLYVENCLFENNTARSNGVIYLDEFGIAEIIDSVFRNNYVSYSGGTVVFDTSKSAVVKNCTFEDNYAVKGGGIYITSYDSGYVSNVTVSDSAFISNYATEYGGAIFSAHDELNVTNTRFNQNNAFKNGGAIYANVGLINIINSSFSENSAEYGGALLLKAENNNVLGCSFNGNSASVSGGAIYSSGYSIKIDSSSFSKNSADYGGALFLKDNENIVTHSSFVKNTAYVTGGAIYSKMENVYAKGNSYSKNSAAKANNVYGVFFAKVTRYTSSSGYVKLKIVLSSPWSMSLSQKIKIKLKGYTSKWVKTNSKGQLTFTVPKNVKVSKSTLSITMDLGVCTINNYIYKDPGKFIIKKIGKKPSKLKVTIKNKYTKKLIKKTKITVKVYTGKHYKTYKLKTNAKGIINVKTSNLSKGKHKITFYYKSSKYYINKKYYVKVK